MESGMWKMGCGCWDVEVGVWRASRRYSKRDHRERSLQGGIQGVGSGEQGLEDWNGIEQVDSTQHGRKYGSDPAWVQIPLGFRSRSGSDPARVQIPLGFRSRSAHVGMESTVSTLLEGGREASRKRLREM